MYIYIYIYIYIHKYVKYTCICALVFSDIYIYILSTHLYVYIYIYTYPPAMKFKAGLLTFERSLEFIESAIKSFKPDGPGSAFTPRLRFKSLLICERQKHCLANAKQMVSEDTCVQKDIRRG